MLNFDFLEKCLGIVFPPHFVYDFLREMFLMLYSITGQISLPDCLYFLVNICIAIICYPGCDVTHFEIKPVFLIKLFFHMTKNSKQKYKYLKNENSF